VIGNSEILCGKRQNPTYGVGPNASKTDIPVSPKTRFVITMKTKFTYVGIRVKDLETSISFYTKFLGMKLKGRSRIEMNKGEVASLVTEDGGFELELNFYEKGSPYATEYSAGEGLDHLCFGVEDLTKALEAARASGYRVISEHKSNGGRWAYVEDPNGIWIELS
jgi:lactoylglutathione lyase